MELTWQTLLQDEFLKRKTGNTRYSMRAFAKALDMSPSYACMVLKGQRSIALAAIKPLCRRLKWAPTKETLFRLLIERDGAKDPSTRADLDAQVKMWLAKNQEFATLELKEFQAMSAWYHVALIELTRVKGFDPTPPAVARRLGISTIEADLAIERLKRLGVLEERDGTLVRSRGPLNVSSSPVPSQAIRRFHKEMLKRADTAIEAQPMAERLVAGATLAVSKDKIDLVRERFDEFRRELTAILAGDDCDAVYHLGLQFFRVDGVASVMDSVPKRD